ncbi:MAG: hypothetical protein ABIQ74_04660 [Chitinophagales bacterium]
MKELGYHIADPDAFEKKSPHTFLRSIESKFFFCLAFTIPLLLHMILPWMWLHDPFVQLALCLPVYLVGLFYFGKSAWASVREGSPNMDVLIFIGSTAAFIYSFAGGVLLHNSDYLFFESTSSIITLVLLDAER